jgi:small-conductance mechanosensitive channel
MDIIQTEWSQIFTRFILWGIILFVLFSLIRYGLPYLLRNNKKVEQIRKYARLVELIVWVFFLSWFTFVFAEIKSIFSLLLFGVILGLTYLLFRFWITDIIAGIIFRYGKQIGLGDGLQIDDYRGKIVNLGIRSIEIENEDGRSIYIPYRKVTSAIFSKTESAAQTSGYTFELETPYDGDIDKVIEGIKTTILALPWSSIRKVPQVSLKGQSEKILIFNITVYSIDRSFFSKIETHVKNKFST